MTGTHTVPAVKLRVAGDFTKKVAPLVARRRLPFSSRINRTPSEYRIHSPETILFRRAGDEKPPVDLPAYPLEETMSNKKKNDMLKDDDWCVLYSYSRAQAIDDGVLVGVSRLAQEAGIRRLAIQARRASE